MTESKSPDGKKKEKTSNNDLSDERSRLDIEMLYKELEKIKDDLREISESANDKISTVDDRIQEKLDTIDIALRGNGRVGVFEQIRNINTQIRIIIVVVLLLIGAKVYNMSLETWISNLIGINQTEKVKELPKEKD